MTLVHSDERRRVSLGKVLEPNRDYRVTKSPHGTVTLEPVTTTTVSDYERAVLGNDELRTRLETAIAAADRGETKPGRRRDRPSA